MKLKKLIKELKKIYCAHGNMNVQLYVNDVQVYCDGAYISDPVEDEEMVTVIW